MRLEEQLKMLLDKKGGRH